MSYEFVRDEDKMTYAALKVHAADPGVSINNRLYAMQLLRDFDAQFPIVFGVTAEKK
jgi:hypothetical protein